VARLGKGAPKKQKKQNLFKKKGKTLDYSVGMGLMDNFLGQYHIHQQVASGFGG
jgi:hypothetical protein